MLLSELSPLPAYFDRYISKNDNVDVISALKISLKELEDAPVGKWKQMGNKVYEQGKWTINQIIQHLIDTERIFTYRAVVFARSDDRVMSYDQDAYAAASDADNRSIKDIHEEAVALRKATIHLFSSFSDEVLKRSGIGFKGSYSVLSIGYIISGHQRWHFEVIKDKYLF